MQIEFQNGFKFKAPLPVFTKHFFTASKHSILERKYLTTKLPKTLKVFVMV